MENLVAGEVASRHSGCVRIFANTIDSATGFWHVRAGSAQESNRGVFFFRGVSSVRIRHGAFGAGISP
jgi:hypothetical protein